MDSVDIEPSQDELIMETDTNSLTKPIENLSKKPAKGILKTPTSVPSDNCPTKFNRQNSQDKDLKWDETNIIQTLHPADKDYGHMKIEEPKTPYSYINDDGELNSDNEMPPDIDPEDLAKLINEKTKTKKSPKSKFSFDKMDADNDNSNSDDSDADDFVEIENETEEERQKRKEFEQKRKKHYNEYQMVKLARKLLKEEMEEDDDEEENDIEK